MDNQFKYKHKGKTKYKAKDKIMEDIILLPFETDAGDTKFFTLITRKWSHIIRKSKSKSKTKPLVSKRSFVSFL